MSEEWKKQRQTIFNHLNNKRLSFQDFSLPDEGFIERLTDKIGGGAVGEVFALGKYVVKKVSPCLADPEKPLYRYCKGLLETDSYLIPGSRGRYRYILPNLVTEIIIGMILGQRFPKHYAKTLAGIVTQTGEGVTVYLIVERLAPIDNGDWTERDLLLMVYQVLMGILEGQASYRLTHYDLHIENVLVKPNQKVRRYPVPNRQEEIAVNPKYLAKISDFALARLETTDIMVTSQVDDFPVKSYGEFSPGYDVMCFLGSLVIDTKYKRAWDSFYAKFPDVYSFLVKFLLWVLEDREISWTTPDQTREVIAKKYYTSLSDNRYTFRPVSDKQFVNYYNIRSLPRVVELLGMIIVKRGWATQISSTYRMSFPKFPKVERFSPNLEFSELPQPGKSLFRFQEMIVGPGLAAQAYHVKSNFPASVYNFTLSDKQIKECPIQEHYLNSFLIKRSALERSQLGLDCCKLDVVNYVLKNDKVMMAINGGFFNIKGDFLPMGVYRDEFVYIDRYDIPKDYQDVFGQVVIQNNRLEIRRFSNKKVKGEQTFSTGPLLIEEGEIVFQPNQLRYICTDESNSKNIIISQDEKTITTKGYYRYLPVGNTCQKEFVEDQKTYRRCDKIDPAELSHADNPNPRSALCILANGDYLFITAEGRGLRGVGFDLYTMALTIKQNFPNVVSAVNLDGGRSSLMAWRGGKNDTIYISNYNRNYIYPVGNLLYLSL